MLATTNAEIRRMKRLLGEEDSKTIDECADGATPRPWIGPVPEFMLQAGIGPLEFTPLCLMAMGGLCAAIVAGLCFGAVWAAIIVAVVAACAWVYLGKRRLERAMAFERDYPAFLISLASAIRTGLDPLTALIQSERLFGNDSMVRSSIVRVKQGIEQGSTEEEAIREFGRDVSHPDIQLFRTAFILARREGSSLAPCLQRLTKVIRQRQSFRRRIRASVAMQKLSSLGIALCAVLIGILQAVMNPRALQEALADPMGVRALSFGVALVLMGLGWMLYMARARI